MGGLDRLVSLSLSDKIKKKIEIDVLKKIERELFLEHGMSIKLSIDHFQKFSNVMKKNTNIDVNKFEKECIDEILKIKKNENNYHITIVDPKLLDFMLEMFGDVETRKMIIILLKSEHTMPQIIKESNIPKTSGYRKIENLIINGLFVETGKILSESKKISKIQCVFQEIIIDIKKEKIVISGIVSKKIFEKSTCLRSILKTFE